MVQRIDNMLRVSRLSEPVHDLASLPAEWGEFSQLPPLTWEARWRELSLPLNNLFQEHQIADKSQAQGNAVRQQMQPRLTLGCFIRHVANAF